MLLMTQGHAKSVVWHLTTVFSLQPAPLPKLFLVLNPCLCKLVYCTQIGSLMGQTGCSLCTQAVKALAQNETRKMVEGLIGAYEGQESARGFVFVVRYNLALVFARSDLGPVCPEAAKQDQDCGVYFHRLPAWKMPDVTTLQLWLDHRPVQN